jgi:fluoride ion exporter CrcB/FEX
LPVRTFSSFSLQTLNLLQRDREWFYAGVNVAGPVVFCLAAVWLGFALGKLLLHFLSK